MGIDGGLAPMPDGAPVVETEFATNPAQIENFEAWDKNKIMEIAKIKEENAQPVKIWNGAIGEYQTLYRKLEGDPRLKALLEVQGFTAKPTLVNATEFDNLVQKGGIRVYRGLTSTDNLSAEKMIEMFKTGDMFVGTGVAGNGVYSSINYDYVIKYAMDKPENVIEMVLSPTAKFIEMEAAQEGADALSMAFYDKAFGRSYKNSALGEIVDAYSDALGGATQDELRALGWLLHEPGAYATTMGYDAIRYSDLDNDGKDALYVILNRGAVVAKK
jgi:hypothetical protein